MFLAIIYYGAKVVKTEGLVGLFDVHLDIINLLWDRYGLILHLRIIIIIRHLDELRFLVLLGNGVNHSAC